MCSGSSAEFLGIIDSEDLASNDRDHNEETMRQRGKAKFIHGLLGQLSAIGNLGRQLNQVGEEVLSLGKIACPVMMTTLLLYTRNIVSMFFLARQGKIELAGGSLALGFANITGLSVIKGLAVGMDPICGQAYGARRWSVLSQAYMKTVCLLLLVSIPVSILWLNVEPIFLQLGQDPDITEVAKVYIVFCIPELIAQAVLHPMRSFLRTQGLATPLTMAAIGAVIFHAPVNYFFATYLNLGVKGVALALAFNTINLNLVLLIYVIVSKKPLKPWHGVTAVSFLQGWRPFMSIAVPSLISVCLEWWWYEIMLFLCGLLGNAKASVSATGILIQTAGLIYVFPFSLSCGLTTRVGQALGAGEPNRAQYTAIIGITLAFTYGLSISVFTTVLRSVWGRWYTKDPQILELVSTALPILGLCELGNSPQTAGCGVLTGTARPKDGVRINLCSFYFVGLPVAVLLTFKFEIGYLGLWFGLLAAQITCVTMMLYTLIRTDWRHQAKRADELTSAVEERNDLETGLLTSDQSPQNQDGS